MRSSEKRKRVEYLLSLIDDAHSEIAWQQDACKHKRVTRVRRSESCTYDSPARWTECVCENCLKRWDE